MTNLSDFSHDELAPILDAPGAVMKAATLADGKPGAVQFLKEMTSGARVFREAQQHENDFVRSVAAALRDRSSTRSASASASEEDSEKSGPNDWERGDTEGPAARAIELTEASMALLRERADQKDADAYGEWLVRIASQVAKATRSKEGGFFSKRVAVTAGEQAYLERLTAAVGEG